MMSPRAMRKRAILIELGSLGVSQKRAAAILHISHPGISVYCKKLGVTLPRERGGFALMTTRSRARAEKMAALYKAGYTLQQIGALHDLTRERVRQLLTKHFGFTHVDGGQHAKAVANRSHRIARLNDQHLKRNGCTWEQYQSIKALGKGKHNERTPLAAFRRQKYNAGLRGIGWELSLWQWWTIWQESGHWEERGRGQGYVMCRRGDVGPYAVGNVFIALAAQNSSEAQAKKRIHPDLPIGVSKTKSGRYEAQRRINGRQMCLGTHDTPELAYAAYLMAGEQMARAA